MKRQTISSASRIFALSLCLIVITMGSACESDGRPTGSNQAEAQATDEPRVSPLGFGQPDPQRIISEALAASERGDYNGFLRHFAFQSKTGHYFVAQDKNASLGADGYQARAMTASLRHLLTSSWADVSYGRPKNVRNSPPTVEVPMTVRYDFDRATPQERERALSDFAAVLEAQGLPQREISWAEYADRINKLPKNSTRRFVFLGGDWRFDAAWKLDPSSPMPRFGGQRSAAR